MKKFIFFLIIISVFILSACQRQSTQQRSDNVIKYTLDNGLTVVLQENHAAPVVAMYVWVKVGSANETDQEAGIAHVHEHMLFKGTERRGVGEIAREVESSGGDINAFTSWDHTVYYLVLASRFFSTGVDILADAIQHSAFDPEELDREKEVVLEEIKRGNDIPRQVLHKSIFETAYQVHPYGRPVIGFESVVKSLSRQQILDFYKKWYVPNNMVLIIVGDVSLKEAKPLIAQAFDGFPNNPLLPSPSSIEPPQTSFRGTVLRDEIKEAYYSLLFHIPSISHDDVYPLDVLSIILGQGESSRLYQTIKAEKDLVYSISSFAYTPKDPGVVMIGGTFSPEKSEAAIKEILLETYRLKNELVSLSELKKARVIIESDSIYDRETVQGQARKLGYYESLLGNPDFEEEYLRHISKVTPEDIQEVARKYFITQNLTACVMLPTNENPDLDTERLRSLAEQAENELKEHRTQEQASSTERKIFKQVFPNGLHLIVRQNSQVPIVAVQVAFLGGLRFENPSNNGINNFMAEMLTKGTTTRTAAEIALEVESMAGEIDGFSGKNSFGLTGIFLSRNFDKGMEIFADILRNPTFPKEELEKKRSDILASIRLMEDNLPHLAYRLFVQNLYPTHPYRMESIGTRESIQSLTQADLRNYFEANRVPPRMSMSIVGDIDPQSVTNTVQRLFGDLSPESTPMPEVPKDPAPSKITTASITKEKFQAHMVLGFQGTTVHDPDHYALDVLSTVLSGQGGRLFLELRDRLSLAYTVFSFSQEGLDPGSFYVYIGTSPEKVEQAREAILKELKKVREEPIDNEEIERAKKYLVGSHEIELQKNLSQAIKLSLNELYQIGFEEMEIYPQKILAVTADDVRRVAKKYIDIDHYTLATIMPPMENSE